MPRPREGVFRLGVAAGLRRATQPIKQGACQGRHTKYNTSESHTLTFYRATPCAMPLPHVLQTLGVRLHPVQHGKTGRKLLQTLPGHDNCLGLHDKIALPSPFGKVFLINRAKVFRNLHGRKMWLLKRPGKERTSFFGWSCSPNGGRRACTRQFTGQHSHEDGQQREESPVLLRPAWGSAQMKTGNSHGHVLAV